MRKHKQRDQEEMSLEQLNSPSMDTDPDPAQDANRKTRSKGKKKRPSKPAVRSNVRAGLHLSTSRVRTIMKRVHKTRINRLAPIYLTGAAEEFVRTIFDSTIHLLGKDNLTAPAPGADESEKKKYAKLAHRRINPQILNQAIKSDPDIRRFVDKNKAIILGGGVLPTATKNMDRVKNLRKQIKHIRQQGLQKLALIREQGREDQPDKEKDKKKKKTKSKKSRSKK